MYPRGRDLISTDATQGQCFSSTRTWFSKLRVYCYSEVFLLKDNWLNVIAYKLRFVSIFCRFLLCEPKLGLVDLIIVVENICSFPYNLPGRMPISFSSALQIHSSRVGHDFIKWCWNFLLGLHETNCRCESGCFSLLYAADHHPYKLQSALSLKEASENPPFFSHQRVSLPIKMVCILGILVFGHFFFILKSQYQKDPQFAK